MDIIMEIIEDYCSFEVSKLLKEKRFDWHTYAYYEDEDNPNINLHASKAIDWNKTEFISKPTLQTAMKWLREVHNISVRPRYDEVEDEKEHPHCMWFFDILSMNPYKTLVEPEQGYSTYEDCCGAAIKYCLENLV